MNNKIKSLLKFLGVFLLCFICIYLFVFCGGWKLFESGDPILIEIGASAIISVFVFAICEAGSSLSKRVDNLEKRLYEIEKKK